MKILVQRVLSASVLIDDMLHGKIGKGLLLYVCFEEGDKTETVDNAIKKVLNLRIFEDKEKKMNLNITQTPHEILSVSQFTLSWDGKKGHRPSFDKSLEPQKAKIFYKLFNDALEKNNIILSKGSFGKDMLIDSINDGPVTFMLTL